MRHHYPLPSQVIKANIDALTSREAVGLQKYGHTLDRKDLTHKEWLNHALEESLDQSNYLRAAVMHEGSIEVAYVDIVTKIRDLVSAEMLHNGASNFTDKLLTMMVEHSEKFGRP